MNEKLWNKTAPLGRIEDYEKVLPILELYPCIQSEGSRFGRPTIAVRTTSCSHRCYFGEGGWCDSFYTSIHPEKGIFCFQDVVKIYDENPHIKEMMLTGGSPTLHPKLVNELTHFANERDILITIETEGSHFLETDYPIDLISLSPKFSNTIPKLGVKTPGGKVTDEKMIKQHNKFRLNYEAMRKTLDYHKDYHFKPVCNPLEQPQVWEEIEACRIELEIPKNKTFIMPPGSTRNELIRVYPMVFEFCAENGYNMTGRDHIIGYGERRQV